VQPLGCSREIICVDTVPERTSSDNPSRPPAERIAALNLPTSTLDAFGKGAALLLQSEEIDWLEQSGIPLFSKTLKKYPEITYGMIRVPAKDETIRPIIQSIWEKTQKIYPDQNVKEATEQLEKEAKDMPYYAFSNRQAEELIKIWETIEKSDRSKSGRYSIVPKKSDPTMMSYQLIALSKEYSHLRQPVYELLDPLTSWLSADEIVRKGKASSFGWNLYGAKNKDGSENLNVVLATLTLKNGRIADCFIQAFLERTDLQIYLRTEAETYHPFLIVPLNRKQLENKESRDKLTSSIEEIRIKLVSHLGSYAKENG
jgi:hypothetical protein